MPISKESSVPETAPAAKSTPIALAQVRARSVRAWSPRLCPRHSAKTVSTGNAMPKQEKMMCHPSDSAICMRAGYRFCAASATSCNGSTPTSAPAGRCRMSGEADQLWVRCPVPAGRKRPPGTAPSAAERSRMQAGRSGAPLRGATDRLRVHASVFQPGAGEEQMTRARDQFAELTQRGQEVFAAAVHAWEQAARSLTTGAAAGVPKARLSDLGATVDAAFDFAAQMLAEQREFTKSLMSAGSQALATAARRAMGDDQSDTQSGTAADATAPVAELPRPVPVEPAPAQPGSAEPASTQAASAESNVPDRAGGDDASDRSPDRTPDQASKGTPDQPSSPGPDRASSRSSDQPSDQGSDRPSDQGSDRPSVQGSDRPSVQSSDRGSSQSADRPTSRAPDRAASQASGPSSSSA